MKINTHFVIERFAQIMTVYMVMLVAAFAGIATIPAFIENGVTAIAILLLGLLGVDFVLIGFARDVLDAARGIRNVEHESKEQWMKRVEVLFDSLTPESRDKADALLRKLSSAAHGGDSDDDAL